MNEPTPEQLAKLPKWARDHISRLEYYRRQAVQALRKFQDEQKPSAFSTVDYLSLGEEPGHENVRRFIQTDSVQVEHRGVCLDVCIRDGGQNGPGIHLQWSAAPRCSMREVAFIPRVHQTAVLKSVEDMS